MTHTGSPTIGIMLTPMQIPETAMLSGVESESAWVTTGDSPTTGCRLRLTPGEASEVVVRLYNRSDRSLYISLQTSGNFPNRWCRIGQEGQELEAGHAMEAVLYFEMEADFFETDELGVSDRLQLNYQGTVLVYGRTAPDAPAQLMQSSGFEIFVRPHSLYPNFLPNIYREVDFIGRLLKIFEESFEPAVHTLENLWAYLDPLTAPQALLPFLAYWVGWPTDYRWSEAQQRRLIRHAMELYRWRGTRRGLRLYLHLYIGLPLDSPDTPEAERHISIEELFTRGFVFGQARLGEDAIIGGGRPFHFIVRLRAPRSAEIDPAFVHTLIQQEKPAFSTYELIIEERQYAEPEVRGEELGVRS